MLLVGAFAGWSGDASGLSNTTVTLNGPLVVTATFAKNTYTLAVTPVGSGSVTMNNTGPYSFGDVVQLTAIPVSGWSFSVWSGDLSGSVNPTTITINGNKTVTGAFTQNQYSLTMYTVGQGSVVPGNQTFASGTVVDIKAMNAAGWSFAGWSGDASGLSNATVTLNGPLVVTATFAKNTYTLAVTPVGSGSVTMNNTGPYSFGDVVQLTAIPVSGWSFSVWSGDLSGSVNPTTITINGNKTVTAAFTQNQYSLTMYTVGQGSVVPGNQTFASGTVVDIKAMNAAGWSFCGLEWRCFGLI